jgi:hypothetical protein
MIMGTNDHGFATNDMQQGTAGRASGYRKDATETIENAAERHPVASGQISNRIITRRNGGVRHQFVDSIGGCSANYR